MLFIKSRLRIQHYVLICRPQAEQTDSRNKAAILTAGKEETQKPDNMKKLEGFFFFFGRSTLLKSVRVQTSKHNLAPMHNHCIGPVVQYYFKKVQEYVLLV